MHGLVLCMILVASYWPGLDRISSIRRLPYQEREVRLTNRLHAETPGPVLNSGESGSERFQFPADLVGGGIDKLEIDLSLDPFRVKPIYVQTNSSFSIVCEFVIGKNSHPTDINIISGERFVDPNGAKAGLAKWTFVGLEPNKKYNLVLRWAHNWGYVSLSILGDEMSLSIRLPKDIRVS